MKEKICQIIENEKHTKSSFKKKYPKIYSFAVENNCFDIENNNCYEYNKKYIYNVDNELLYLLSFDKLSLIKYAKNKTMLKFLDVKGNELGMIENNSDRLLVIKKLGYVIAKKFIHNNKLDLLLLHSIEYIEKKYNTKFVMRLGEKKRDWILNYDSK